MKYWIRIFGCPKNFLYDDDDDFGNQQMLDLEKKFGITIKNKAPESLWSIDLCKRHNCILNKNVNKILAGGNCSLQTAIHWAVSSKNSIANLYGFSPNVLVLGSNPDLPNTFGNMPNLRSCLSNLVAKNINAICLVRKGFIQQQAAECLHRELNHKSHTDSNRMFFQGDRVYYYRNKKSEWHGPAVVIGKEGQNILVKQGGLYIRLHTCRLQMHKSILQSVSEIQSLESPVVCPNFSQSDGEDDDQATADEGGDWNKNIFFESTRSNNVIDTVAGHAGSVSSKQSDSWIHVANNQDLPKLKSTIECKFPNQVGRIRCEILSCAGKATTSNWHFLNIQETKSDKGKCYSFKNASWRPILGDKDKASHEVFYSDLTFGCTEVIT